MDASIIPTAWKSVLEKIQQKFPSAIIAGGALRDTIVGNKVKDVDIFIYDDPFNSVKIEDLSEIFDLAEIVEDTVERDHIRLFQDSREKKKELVNYVVNIEENSSGYDVEEFYLDNSALVQSYINVIFDVVYNGQLYQLIFIESDPVKHVNDDFDFGICKIFFDGQQLYITDEFWYDYNNRQLTIVGSYSHGQIFHTLFKHRVSLLKKFPGWKVVLENIRIREPHEQPPSYREAVRRCEAAVSEQQRLKEDREAKIEDELKFHFEKQVELHSPYMPSDLEPVGLAPSGELSKFYLPRIANPADGDELHTDVTSMSQYASQAKILEILGLAREEAKSIEQNFIDYLNNPTS